MARKLAVKFVSDDPPRALVDRLAQVYLEHDTDDRPGAARAGRLRASSRAPVGAKVRDPGEDLVATYRALGVTRRAARPTRRSAANRCCGRSATSGVDAVRVAATRRPADRQRVVVLAVAAARLDGHPLLDERRLVAHRPGIPYRPPASWLPEAADPLRRLSSTTCRSGCCTGARPRALLQACCEAVDAARPARRSPATTPLVQWSCRGC